MSKRKILKRGKKKPTKNLGLLRGKGWGGGGIKKVNGSWAKGVRPPKPPTNKPKATKLALKSTTGLTRPSSPAFKKTVKTIKQAAQPTMRKGVSMLKNKAQPVPKNVRPAKTIKRKSPKR